MRFYLGNTDNRWFRYLSRINPEDVNFWKPKGNSNFRFLQQNEPFLLKLKSPYHHIAGVGFFSSHTILPLTIAWDVFGDRNGCASYSEFQQMIKPYRTDSETNPKIGCTVLTSPIFFKEKDWIPVHDYMARMGPVQGKGFSTTEPVGRKLWQQIQQVLCPAGVSSHSHSVAGTPAFRFLALVGLPRPRRCTVSSELSHAVLNGTTTIRSPHSSISLPYESHINSHSTPTSLPISFVLLGSSFY